MGVWFAKRITAIAVLPNKIGKLLRQTVRSVGLPMADDSVSNPDGSSFTGRSKMKSPKFVVVAMVTLIGVVMLSHASLVSARISPGGVLIQRAI